MSASTDIINGYVMTNLEWKNTLFYNK